MTLQELPGYKLACFPFLKRLWALKNSISRLDNCFLKSYFFFGFVFKYRIPSQLLRVKSVLQMLRVPWEAVSPCVRFKMSAVTREDPMLINALAPLCQEACSIQTCLEIVAPRLKQILGGEIHYYKTLARSIMVRTVQCQHSFLRYFLSHWHPATRALQQRLQHWVSWLQESYIIPVRYAGG